MKINSILVSNNHLEKLGGSETFTYTLIKEFKQKGYTVEYFTFHKGIVSNRIESELGVSFMSNKKYDIIFSNHNTTVEYLMHNVKGKIIQTCHGIYPSLEQPYKYADAYISISWEVQNHLQKLGFKSRIILNGIDLDRYKSLNPINHKPKKVLSLCQSDSANKLVKSACEELSLEFMELNKNSNPIWSVEKEINNADIVIGLGRSIYEAMACGRPSIIYDERSYSESYADGYLTLQKLEKSILHNCSGRQFKLNLNKKLLIAEFQKYNSNDATQLRSFAEKKLNIKISSEEYLEYAKKTKINIVKRFRFRFRMFKRSIRNKIK